MRNYDEFWLRYLPAPGSAETRALHYIGSVLAVADLRQLTERYRNVANFVDVTTGGWGEAIQGPLNGGQTPTMANFATLADVLAGCTTRVVEDACAKLFAAATPPIRCKFPGGAGTISSGAPMAR